MAKEFPIICTFTIPANEAAYSYLTVHFLGPDPRKGSQTEIQVPKGKVWIIKDVYVKDAPAIDAIVQFFKNDEGPKETTQPLSTLLWSNEGRQKPRALVYEEFSKLSAYAINLAAGGTEDTTITFYMRVQELDATDVAKAAPAVAKGVLDKLRAAIAR